MISKNKKVSKKEKVAKRETTGADKRLVYLNRVLIVLLVIVSFIFGTRLINMNILPVKYMALYVIFMIFINILLFLGAGKKIFAPAVAVVLILIICGLSYFFAALNKLNDTLQKVFSDAGQETVQMAVVILADDPAETVSDINGSKIGYIGNDESAQDVKKEIDKIMTIPATYREYTDILALADALLNGTENAIILNSAYIGIISDQDNYGEFSEKIKIVYMIEVNVSTYASGSGTKSDTESDGTDTKSTPDSMTDSDEESDKQEDYKLSSNENTFIMYISGIDTFGSINVKSRSDVNILLALNMETGHMQLINTPRDYYVTLPDRGEDKLTHAGLYGVECSRAVLENLYGITIDYYMRVNFSGFEDIIDFLGGIDVYSEYEFTVEPIKHYIVGYNHLSGIEALAFARERYSFSNGDVQRGSNQMEVIKAIISKALSTDMLVNYSEIMEEVSECFQTDLPPNVIYDLVRYQLSNNVPWQVDSFTVKGTGSHEVTYSIPGTTSYVMIPNEEDVKEARRLIEDVLAGDR